MMTRIGLAVALMLALVGCGTQDGPDAVAASCGASSCASPNVCMSYFQGGAENFVCAPPCATAADCESGCCYPAGQTGACMDALFCAHAAANGH